MHAVIRGLRAADVPNENIVIFDQYQSRMARSHFRVGHPILDVPVECADTRGYQSNPTAYASGLARFATALADATAVINLPVVKDHHSCGVAISTRNVTHGLIDLADGATNTACSPSIVDLLQSEMVSSRNRVTLADGLRVMYDGGPADGPNKVIRSELLIGTDPIAIDTIGLDLIDQLRAERGLASLETDGRGCEWLSAAQERGLGIHDRQRITLETHQLG